MEILLYLVLALLAVFVVCKLLRKSRNSVSGRSPPGPISLPIFGSILEVDISCLYESCSKLASKYGDIVQFTIFGQRIVLLNTPDLIHKAFVEPEYCDVMNDRPESFIGKYLAYDFSNIAFAKYDRKYIQLKNVFHKALRLHIKRCATFDSEIETELNTFLQDIEDFKGEPCEFNSLINTSFGKLTCVLLSGEAPNTQDAANLWRFEAAVFELVKSRTSLFMNAFPFLRHLPGRFGRLFDTVIDIRAKFLHKYYWKIKANDNTSCECTGLADILIQAREDENGKAGIDFITEDNIKAMLGDVVSTALSSTAHTTAAAFLALLNNPRYMARLQEEIDRVIGREGPVTLSHRDQMPLSGAFTLEVLRYTNVAANGIPHRAMVDCNFEGYLIKEGTLIFPNIWYINHSDAIWGDPWTFRPDRFLDDNGDLLSINHALRRSLIPFSVGRRACPGDVLAKNRLFVYVTSVLQRFDLVPGVPLLSDDPRSYTSSGFRKPPTYTCRANRRL